MGEFTAFLICHSNDRSWSTGKRNVISLVFISVNFYYYACYKAEKNRQTCNYGFFPSFFGSRMKSLPSIFPFSSVSVISKGFVVEDSNFSNTQQTLFLFHGNHLGFLSLIKIGGKFFVETYKMTFRKTKKTFLEHLEEQRSVISIPMMKVL